MKKLMIFSMAILFAIAGQAQRETQLGIKAGLNLSDYNDAVAGASTRTGFHAGLLAHIHLNRQWALQPEVVYSTQGAEFTNGKDKIDYINIPLLFQYMARGGLRIQTGPQLGFLTSAKFEDNNGTSYNRRNQLNAADFAWSFGLGYLSRSGLGVDGRYNLGISDVTKGGIDVNNRVWQLGLFYQFRH